MVGYFFYNCDNLRRSRFLSPEVDALNSAKVITFTFVNAKARP